MPLDRNHYRVTLLLVGLFCFSPLFLMCPNSNMVMAQTPDVRKAEGNRLSDQGLQQYQIGQLEAAIQSWQQALSIYRQLDDHRSESIVLARLGICYNSLKDHQTAIQYLQESLNIAQKIQDNHIKSWILENIGDTYLKQENYLLSTSYYRQWLLTVQELQDRKSESRALEKLGDLYSQVGYSYSIGNEELAASYYRSATEFYEALLTIARQGKDRNQEAITLGKLSSTYGSLQNHLKEIEYLEKRLTIEQENKDRKAEIAVLQSLGDKLKEQHNFSAAVEYYTQLIKFLHSNEVEYIIMLQKIEETYIDIGNFQNAFKYHEKYLPVEQEHLRELGNHTYESSRVDPREILRYARLKFRDGEYESSIQFAQRLLIESRKSGVQDSQEYEVDALELLGVVYTSWGDKVKRNIDEKQSVEYYRLALSYLHNLLELLKKQILFDDKSQINLQVRTLRELGLLNSYLKNYSKAIEYYQQGLLLSQKIGDYKEEQEFMGEVGNTYVALGDYRQAIEYYQKSLALVGKVNSAKAEIKALNELGDIYKITKNYTSALTYYQRSLPLEDV